MVWQNRDFCFLMFFCENEDVISCETPLPPPKRLYARRRPSCPGIVCPWVRLFWHLIIAILFCSFLIQSLIRSPNTGYCSVPLFFAVVIVVSYYVSTVLFLRVSTVVCRVFVMAESWRCDETILESTVYLYIEYF